MFSAGHRVLAFLLLSLGLLLAGCDHSGGIRYQLPQAGNVSAAVYDAEGRLVRELLRGAPQEAGQHSLIWDGLDRAAPPAVGWRAQPRRGRREALHARA